MAERRCVILVPVADRIEPECERPLADLAKRGYEVRRMAGHSAIDMARSIMASDALAEGFDELVWIDADIGFSVEAFERLRSHDLPVVCGIYPKKGLRELACHVMPGTKEIVFGEGGGLIPLLYAATGFLYTRRDVYETMRERLSLPLCNARFGRGFYPYFLPMTVEDTTNLESGPDHWYLGEDFAFCERARRAGFEIMADTSIRLVHVGRYRFSWEDAGGERPRYANFRVVLDVEPDVPPKPPS
jgi:hypothetical protein